MQRTDLKHELLLATSFSWWLSGFLQLLEAVASNGDTAMRCANGAVLPIRVCVLRRNGGTGVVALSFKLATTG